MPAAGLGPLKRAQTASICELATARQASAEAGLRSILVLGFVLQIGQTAIICCRPRPTNFLLGASESVLPDTKMPPVADSPG